MLTQIHPTYKQIPSRFFRRSPIFYSYYEFEKACENGTQECLLGHLEYLAKDWYAFLCREFYLESVPCVVLFFPEKKFTVKPKVITTGDCGFGAVGELPDRVITTHWFRYSLEVCRLFPGQMFFDTIPHEVAHAIANQLFVNDVENVGHGKEWKEVMDFIGITSSDSVEIGETIALEKFSEPVQSSLSVKYSWET